MDNVEQQVINRLKQATNVLVTVSNNPSVDQLSACIGLTIILNKVGKHGTAVFSGKVPSIIEFLQPEKTLEKNTDSLQDFIVALDKSKADKLRYKVEDKLVKIFITPYHTSLSEKDLQFSQGDFNVDVVMALGVKKQEELDHAISSHGQILHDATVITVNNTPNGNLGSINWTQSKTSSLSELVYDLGIALNKNTIDAQVATALLTGIVAETKRFSNNKTLPQTMSISAALMAAGANQELVATKLEPPAPVIPVQSPALPTTPKPQAQPKKPEPPKQPPLSHPAPKPKDNEGTLEIEHEDDIAQIQIDKDGTLHLKKHDQAAPVPEVPSAPTQAAQTLPAASSQPAASPEPQAQPASPSPPAPESGGLQLPKHEEPTPDMIRKDNHGTPLFGEPGAEAGSEDLNHGGSFTAGSSQESLDPSTDPLSAKGLSGSSMSHNLNPEAAQTSGSPSVDSARNAINEALAAQTQTPVPSEPLASPAPVSGPSVPVENTANTLDMPLPQPPAGNPMPPTMEPSNGTPPPPPVPPPMIQPH